MSILRQIRNWWLFRYFELNSSLQWKSGKMSGHSNVSAANKLKKSELSIFQQTDSIQCLESKLETIHTLFQIFQKVLRFASFRQL